MRGLIIVLLQVVLFVVLLTPANLLASGGAGIVARTPDAYVPGRPSVIGDLTISVSKDGKSLEGRIIGQCGPLGADAGKTEKFVLTQLKVPYTVKKFREVSSLDVAEELDGFFLNLDSIPPALQVCLDGSEAAPQFAVYPHHIVEKTVDSLKAKVILLNLQPVQ